MYTEADITEDFQRRLDVRLWFPLAEAGEEVRVCPLTL